MLKKNERPTSNKVFCRLIHWLSVAHPSFDVRCSNGAYSYSGKASITQKLHAITPSHPAERSHLYLCELSEIEIEKAWDLDSGPDFDCDPDTDWDFDFDETIYMRWPCSTAGRALTIGGRLDIYSCSTQNQPMMPDRQVFASVAKE